MAYTNKSFEALTYLKADKYKDVIFKFADLLYTQYGIEIIVKTGVVLKRHRTLKTVVCIGDTMINCMSGKLTWRKIFKSVFPLKMCNNKRRTYFVADKDKVLRTFMISQSIEEACVKLDLGILETTTNDMYSEFV